MISKNYLISLWFILTLLAGQANCALIAQNRKVKFNEIFTLQPDEIVETEDGKLKVRLKTVGRTISESGEVEYVELQVQWSNTQYH